MSLDPFNGMLRCSIAQEFDAVCILSGDFVAGEVHHMQRNQRRSTSFTSIARFFAWHPAYSENVHKHWRVDCFVRSHALSPNSKIIGRALAEGLLREAVCREPLWFSWHRSEEIGGTNYGELFDLD